MAALLWLSVGLPLLGAVVVRFARATGPLTIAAAAVAAVAPWALLVGAAEGERARSSFGWLPAAGLDVGLRLDGLSAAMTVTVATIGLVVLIYATGYFATDRRRRSALAGLLAFLAAMQGLVLADGYLALLVFWELVGASSARLIAFSRDDSAAAPAATRAFLTTRAADLGFYLAVLALYTGAGTLAFGVDRPDGAFGAIVGVGLLLAAMGKSAQAPLHTWLAGAMAGPTPVSALLHSATMVAAGVYLLARSHQLLAGWPLEAAGWIGALTAVGGAAIALAQNDLKRVLAGSTTSQLGLMFVGVAAGGPAVAVFHLIAHAAGKAGLFLAAGVFQHERGSTLLERLRGAGRDDRPAMAGFAICALSIAAVPPLAAFWSKDHIAAAAQPHAVWFALVLVAAAGSTAYLLRPALILWAREGAHGPAVTAGRPPMLASVGGLAVASLGLGLIGAPLARLLGGPVLPSSTVSLALSLGAAVLGATVVARPIRAPARLARAARDQLYGNQALEILVQRPVLAASGGLDVVERGIDAAVDSVGRGGIALARANDWVERRGIDAAVDGLARLVGRGGGRTSEIQSGRLYEYLRDALLGAAAIALVVVITALT